MSLIGPDPKRLGASLEEDSIIQHIKRRTLTPTNHMGIYNIEKEAVKRYNIEKEAVRGKGIKRKKCAVKPKVMM